jgi:hypothetical protein
MNKKVRIREEYPVFYVIWTAGYSDNGLCDKVHRNPI